MQEGALLAWEPQFWKRKILLQASGKMGGRQLMAVAIGARPSIFFSSTESKEISVVHTAVSDTKASKAERQASFDCKRGLLALAAHPTDASTLFQLHNDSSVSAITLRSSQRNPDVLWTMTLQSSSLSATEVGYTPRCFVLAKACKVLHKTAVFSLKISLLSKVKS